mmetsp:Transcript_34003/g.104013  ORF Transcript_34003/g.104013 Transcript_34003/m.104013 type:complete len:260 (-) Transcript_34003:740-1519(-)
MVAELPRPELHTRVRDARALLGSVLEARLGRRHGRRCSRAGSSGRDCPAAGRASGCSLRRNGRAGPRPASEGGAAAEHSVRVGEGVAARRAAKRGVALVPRVAAQGVGPAVEARGRRQERDLQQQQRRREEGAAAVERRPGHARSDGAAEAKRPPRRREGQGLRPARRVAPLLRPRAPDPRRRPPLARRRSLRRGAARPARLLPARVRVPQGLGGDGLRRALRGPRVAREGERRLGARLPSRGPPALRAALPERAGRAR